MEFTAGALDPSKRYTVIGPLAYDEKLLVVMNQKVVVGSVPRAAIRRIRIEPRSSFKHPVVGSVIGLIGLAGPLMPSAARSLGAMDYGWLKLLEAAGDLMLVVGILVLVCVMRRREIPWLVVETDGEQRCFPLEKEVTPVVEQLVKTLDTVHSADSGLGVQPNLN